MAQYSCEYTKFFKKKELESTSESTEALILATIKTTYHVLETIIGILYFK